MLILDSEIRRILNDEKEFRYARFLDIKKILERMTISFDENNASYRINARIEEQQEKYILSLKINTQGQIIQYHCGCPYETSSYACRHVGALLLFIRKLELKSFPYFYENNDKVKNYVLLEKNRQQRIVQKKYDDSMQLIELYKERLKRDSYIPLSSNLYQLKVFVSKNNNQLEIFLKILNSSQAFIIKNLKTFIEAIKNHEELKYGKSFSFIHSYRTFDENSKDIIAFVEKYYLRQQLYSQNTKSLFIDDSNIDEFFELMNSLPSYYSDIEFKKKNIRIPLEIKENENDYIIDFENYHFFENEILSNTSLYQFQNDALTQYEFDNQGLVIIFVKKLLESKGGFYIPKESIYNFYKYVFIDILDYVQCSTHVFDEYHQENFINLYADITTNDQIYIELEYIYDEEMKYGFDKENQHLSKEADLVEEYLKDYIDDQDGNHIYLIGDHDFVYSFLTEGLPYLSSYAQIFVSDALKNFTMPHDLKMNVGVSVSNHLLDIQIDSLQIKKEELLDILKAYKKKRKFYKLKNGQLVSLKNEQLAELNQLTNSLQIQLQEIDNGHISVPMYRLFDVDKLMKSKNIHYVRSKEFDQLYQEFYEKKEFEVPKHYQSILREYQIQGYQWLKLMEHYHFSGILADDMGLGKTLQMITYLESIKGNGKPSLVITPASLLLNWQDEIQKFSSSLKTLCIYGAKSVRDEMIQNIEDYDVIITSYDYMRRDVDLYEKKEFHTIVLDEAQYIKNPKTRNAISVKRLQSIQRFALTGTPIENSLAEMWSIFDFLMPGYLYNYTYFNNHFEKPIVKDLDSDKQVILRDMISPFILRRNKKEVLQELPDKIEQTMYYQFDEEEEKIYYAHLVQINKELQQKLDMQQIGKIDILAMLTKLRQICQDARLMSDREQVSSKIKGCMELIHSLKENHKKVLLFSSFTSVLALLQEQCIKEHISFYVLDGSTPRQKRKQYVDAFQNDDTTLFLISLKAGGSGLNLTAAQAVIHFDPWWNMSVKNQATDRAHRIGQKETIQVFSLIMKNTIEEKIMELQKNKKELSDALLDQQTQSLSSMTIDDIRSLFDIEKS